MDSRPIGVFDSGVGGLSVVMEMRRQLPSEDILYFADTAHCPYGPRPADEVRRLTADAVGWLLDHEAKLVVVACNSATTTAIGHLRATFPVAFVGVEPAVKPAAARTRSGKVGVLATAVTLQGPVYAGLVDRYATGVTVYSDPVDGLVESVEGGAVDPARVGPILHRALDPMVAAGVDTLVLGCTHFPFARGEIEAIVGPGVDVIDSGEAVVRQLGRVLDERNLRNDSRHIGVTQHHCSGDPQSFQRTVQRLTTGGSGYDDVIDLQTVS